MAGVLLQLNVCAYTRVQKTMSVSMLGLTAELAGSVQACMHMFLYR